MAVKIGSNIASSMAQRQLAKTSSELSSVYERLSSGMRINKASDDAAGLAIATTLRSDSRVFSQGIRNLNDGISLLNVADGAIESLTNVVVRLKELAEQSANGTYSKVQRDAVDKEAQALSKEYSRIIHSTQYNGRAVLSSSGSKLSLQAGYGNSAVLSGGTGGLVGTGSFSGITTYRDDSVPGAWTYSVEAGDLNGDGIMDLVSAGQVGGGPMDGAIFVRMGTGGGTFSTATSYTDVFSNASFVELGDVNGDGILDLVSGGSNDAGTAGYIAVRIGVGDGTFASASSIAGPPATIARIELADINNDGMLDIASVGGGGGIGGAVTIRMGQANGTFGDATSYSNHLGSARDLKFGDINGDGNLDLLTAGYDAGYNGGVTVRLGNGNGGFGSAVGYAAEADRTLSMDLADLNGDGILDLVSAGRNDSFTGLMTVRLGTGSGNFSSSITTYAMEADYANALTLLDINGDGWIDAITAGISGPEGTATVRLGGGNGSFGGATSYSMQAFSSFDLEVADLNGDGVLDIAIGGRNDSAQGESTIRFGLTTEGTSPLINFSLQTRADALQALSSFSSKLGQLTSQRSAIGTYQSRIGIATSALQATSDNYTAAAARITDADIALETLNLTRLKILQQAASAILSQANQEPALALKLLRG